jgi:hypothetical protein
MSQPKETRDDRVAKLKRKFLALNKVRRIKEYVRYDRAADGDLPHPYPQEYVENCRDALWELLWEDYEKEDKLPNLERYVRMVRRRPSKSFFPDPATKPDNDDS